jgi:hypothetical protein
MHRSICPHLEVRVAVRAAVPLHAIRGSLTCCVSVGFDSYLGFLSGCEDHQNQQNCCGPCNKTKYNIGKVIDLFGGDLVGPAYADQGQWNGFTFTNRATTVIEKHAQNNRNGGAEKPLFLYAALHNTHVRHSVVAVVAAKPSLCVCVRVRVCARLTRVAGGGGVRLRSRCHRCTRRSTTTRGPCKIRGQAW